MKQLFTFFMSFLMGFLVLQTSGELLASERLPLKETQVQNARFLINESFVNGIPDDWTVINANNDPHTWVGFAGDGYSNNFSASIRSWAFPHDDYLVTPQITVEEDMVLSLWAKSGNNFFLESISILVSTTGLEPEDFTIELEDIPELPDTWTQYSHFLTNHDEISVGDHVYIAVYCYSNNKFHPYVDDVMVFVPQPYSFTLLVPSGVSVDAGDSHDYTVTINNTGTSGDHFTPAIDGDGDWAYELFLDDGTTPVTESIFVESGSSVGFIVRVTIPEDIGLGQTDTENFTVTSAEGGKAVEVFSITTTGIGKVTSPFFDNFANASPPNFPNGWKRIVQTTGNGYVRTTTFTQPFSPPHHAELANGNDLEAEIILISPAITNDLNTLSLSFYAKRGFNPEVVIVGTIADPDDPATFTPYVTIEPTRDYLVYTVDFGGYEGDDERIAFKHGTTGNFRNIFIDNFAIGQAYTLTMEEPFGNGTVIPAPGDHPFTEGSEVTITAAADYTFLFDYWEVNGDFYSDEASTTIVIEDDITVRAFFEALDSYTLTMLAPEGNGSVTPEPGDYAYLEDDIVNLVATPDFGWVFSHWTGVVEDPDSPATTITMDDDHTVQAHFIEFEGLDLPWSEGFTGLPNGSIPANWARDAANWGVNNAGNAGGEAPEMRFNWNPSVSGEFYLYSPRIKTSGHDMLELSFKNFVDNFSGPGEYTLKVVAIADDVEYLIEEWVDPETIPAYEFEATLTAAEHGVGTDYFHIAWVFDGNSLDINWWNFDDILLQPIGDAGFTVTFDVTDADGFPVDDAVITLGDLVNEAGDYVFEGLAEGTYAYTVSSICYIDSTGEVTVGSNMLVEVALEMMPGDANGDGMINVLDAILVGNYYVGDSPEFICFDNADVNSDGVIDILDIIAIINIFQSGKVAPEGALVSETAHLYLHKDGIAIKSDGTLAGLQFEIASEVTSIKLDEALHGHELIYGHKNGMMRVMILSLDNSPIPAGLFNLVSFDETNFEIASARAGNLNAEDVPVLIYHDEVTGITDVSEFGFTVYPNPVADRLFVEFDNDSKARISLVNLHGQVVDEQHVAESGRVKLELNTRDLQSGVYVLQLNQNGNVISQKVIVQ